MMRFRRAVQRYGDTQAAQTPYARAGQVWDDRLGSARVQAHHWRLMAFASAALSLLLAVGLVWQGQQSQIIPYIVAVDRLGTPTAVGPADRMRTPDATEIGWFLGHFIQDVRGVGLDPVLTRRNWLEAYDFVSPRGAAFLNTQARGSDPFAQQGLRTVTVQLISVIAISPRSYQVRWSETAYAEGSRTGQSEWAAILTILLQPPRTADAVKRNPLGILIDGIDWSEDIDGGDHSATAAPGSQSGPAIPASHMGQSS
jgi:type IV secretion system protein TrbF